MAKKMIEKIVLNTHDGSNNYLQHLEGNKYKLVTECNYIRAGTVADHKEFIDPSGGPMLVEGDQIEGTEYFIDGFEFNKEVGCIVIVK